MPSSLTRVLTLVTCSAVAVGGLAAGPVDAAAKAPAAAHHYLAGDFDGDGHRDLVIGAPGSNRFRITYSHLVVKGSHTVTVAPSSHPSQAMNFGTAFAVGDFNGDGYSDLAVTAPQYTTSTKVGAVFIYRGSKTGLHATPLSIIGPGPEDEDSDFYNEISLAAADLTGDGRTDLAVGTGTSVRIYHGSKTGLTTKGFSKINEGGGDFNGADSLALGDFNADHHLDLVVGRHGGDVKGDGDVYGQLDVFYGTAHHSLSSTRHIIVGNKVGGGQYAGFGMSIAAGDFNGDGHPDLAAGIEGSDLVTVLFGGKPGLVVKNRQTVTEQSAGVTGDDLDAFGTAVVAGRITDDAYSDLVVGAPDATVGGKDSAGEVFVIHGSGDGLTGTHAQHITMATSGVPGAPTADADFGAALYIGDVAGSSRPDVVIGAPTDSQSKYQAGYVVRLLGTDNGVTTSKSASIGSKTASALFGAGLA